MPRIFIILVVATCSIFGWMFYQYSVQQSDLGQLHNYRTVLYEKAELIYQQAQDWSKPMDISISDDRLEGDYKVMADFVLQKMIANIEARNQYLRDLKAIHWDKFLDIERLDKDRQQKFVETEQMLKQAHLITAEYQLQLQQREAETLTQAKKLPIKSSLKQLLTDSLRESHDSDNTHALLALELQVLNKADALFVILKNNKWEKKNKTFMFYEDQPLKEFNALYQQVLQLNAEMEEIKKHNRSALEQRL